VASTPDGTHGRAKRSLGQNFLVDQNLQRKIVSALGAGVDDEVLEVGPGRGALTQHLIGTVRHLTLVELDDDLAASLEEEHADRDDVSVIHGDVLKVPMDRLTSEGSLRVIGNIPYNITTPIIFRFLERPRPMDMIFMVQAEVADRIVAPVGTKAYGALSIGVRSVARVQRLFKVSRGAFRPVPGVDSAIIRITPLQPEPLGAADELRLRRVVRSCFQWRRKQLRRILRDHPELGYTDDVAERAAAAAECTLDERPERLSPDQFCRLALALP
jgi:16S rRNA (adenine1518-N6/adenine1519-N6)-dimethyltransferase